jgi:hypothetical protein
MIDARAIFQQIQAMIAQMIGNFYYNGGMRIWNDGTQVGLAYRYQISGSVATGEVLELSQTVAGRVKQCVANSDMPIGVAMSDGNDGDYIWVGCVGKFYMLFKGGVTGTAGYVAYVSDTAGRADNAATLPSTTLHNREIGHVISTGSSGGMALVHMTHAN